MKKQHLDENDIARLGDNAFTAGFDHGPGDYIQCADCGKLYPAKLRVCRCDCQSDSEFYGDDVE